MTSRPLTITGARWLRTDVLPIAMPEVLIGLGVGSSNSAWRFSEKKQATDDPAKRGLGIHHAAADSDTHAVWSGVSEEIEVDGENSVV